MRRLAVVMVLFYAPAAGADRPALPSPEQDCEKARSAVRECVRDGKGLSQSDRIALVRVLGKRLRGAAKPDREMAGFNLRWSALADDDKVRDAVAAELVRAKLLPQASRKLLMPAARVIERANQLMPKNAGGKPGAVALEPWPLDASDHDSCFLAPKQKPGQVRIQCHVSRCASACYAQEATIDLVRTKNKWRLLGWQVGMPHDNHHGCGICY